MSGIRQMLIKISNLTAGEYHFNFDERIEKIDLGDPFIGNFKTFITLNKLHNQLILDSRSELTAQFECDRCGIEFTRELESEYEMVYLMNEEPQDTEAINVTYLSHDAVNIDIKNDLREFAILSIPMKKLCKEDCKGLCYRCGGDLNKNECSCTVSEIDPRWQKLIDLTSNLKNNK